LPVTVSFDENFKVFVCVRYVLYAIPSLLQIERYHTCVVSQDGFVLQFVEEFKKWIIPDGTIARFARNESWRPNLFLATRPDRVVGQFVSWIADDDNFRAGNECVRKKHFSRRFAFVASDSMIVIRYRVFFHGNFERDVVSFLKEDLCVFHAIRPGTHARDAIGYETHPGAVRRTLQLEFRQQIVISAELVVAITGKANDIIVMICLCRQFIDCIFLGIVSGKPVRIVAIRKDDVAVFYSIFKIYKFLKFLLEQNFVN